MAKFKREMVDIDETALLQSIYEQGQTNVQGQPAIQEKPAIEEKSVELAEKQAEKCDTGDKNDTPEKPKEAKRKRNQVDYSSLFLQRNELKDRSCVYISRRIHATITEIVRVIADRDVTVGGYIDNVLLQHLETHKDEINNLYKRERKDLIDL